MYNNWLLLGFTKKELNLINCRQAEALHVYFKQVKHSK